MLLFRTGLILSFAAVLGCGSEPEVDQAVDDEQEAVDFGDLQTPTEAFGDPPEAAPDSVPEDGGSELLEDDEVVPIEEVVP